LPSNLKDKYLQVQIQVKEQMLEENRLKVIDEFRDDLYERVLDGLKRLKEGIRLCKLTDEQAKMIEVAIEESFKTLTDDKTANDTP
jgi:hypothetical protein